MSVPQVAKRVDEINAWRSVQKAEADMARAGNAATHVVKEYPEQGYKWVELRAPEVDVKALGYTTEKVGDLYHAVDPQGNVVLNTRSSSAEEALNRAKPAPKELEDALKYEGETMGHCVGGYCPDVVEGRSKIFSLRDDRGRPHVTIEVQPGKKRTLDKQTVREYLTSEEAPMYFAAAYDPNVVDIESQLRASGLYDVMAKRLGLFDEPPMDIVQIKGKGNKAPKEDYLPAVQDFVRSGNFGKVGDLQNTGLIDLRDPNAVLRALVKVSPERDLDKGIDNFNQAVQARPEGPQYMTLDEMRDFLGGTPPEGFSHGGRVRGYAEGGQVSGANFPTDDFDLDRIDAIVGELHAMNAA
jgi:hypothetical protein